MSRFALNLVALTKTSFAEHSATLSWWRCRLDVKLRNDLTSLASDRGVAAISRVLPDVGGCQKQQRVDKAGACHPNTGLAMLAVSA